MSNFDALEQYMLELVNRARLDPVAEAERYGLADLNQGVANGITGDPLQPLAGNNDARDAAVGHANWMLVNDIFQHNQTTPSQAFTGTRAGDRMAADGYAAAGTFSWGENISWSGTTGTLDNYGAVTLSHERLFLSDGHRTNILSDAFAEVGIGQLEGVFRAPDQNGVLRNFNASMIAQDFGSHASRQNFLTGVVFDDTTIADDFYTPGEGLGNVFVSVSGVGTATSGAAGGYELAGVTGLRTVTFSSGALSSPVSVSIAMSGGNVKLDLIDRTTIQASQSVTLGSGAVHAILLGDATEAVGNQAANSLTGNRFDNILSGGGGNDTLDGGDGNDILEGGSGNDLFLGGDGFDVVDYSAEGGNSGLLVNLSASYASDTFGDVDLFDGIERVIGTSGGDLLYGGVSATSFDGGEGDDQLWGYANTGDELDGGAGVNVLVALGGSTTITGGDDTDYVLTSYGDNIVNTGDGNDQVYLRYGTNAINLGEGYNLVLSNDVFETSPNDFFADSTDTIIGGSLDDYIYAGRGEDVILGGGGNDWLSGGRDADTITGGGGFDRFIFGDETGTDTIIDFTDGTDYLDFTTSTFVSSFADLTLSTQATGLLVTWQGGQSGALLTGFAASDFSAADILV